MTSITSDTPVDELVAILMKYQRLQVEAMEREDVRAGNRHFDRLSAALKQLAKTSPGRDALEQLLQDEMPEIRLRAAETMMAWDPERAIPVLGRLVAYWRPKDPLKGYVAVADEAAGWLYDHFGITDYDQNKLIEPLRRYGIELPRHRPYEEIWT